MLVATTNIRPMWLRPAETTKDVIAALEEAAAAGVRLIAFGEALLPGYPVWANRTPTSIMSDPKMSQAYAQYLKAAVSIDGPEVSEIVAACRDLDLVCYLSVTERTQGSMYATLLTVDPEHGVVGAHRKLQATYGERMVWATGDGHGLRTHDRDGWRVGGLGCWENWMPQARHALYADGEVLHVSVWPGSTTLTSDIVRFVAMEGRVFSLAAGTIIDAASIPTGFALHDELVSALGSSDGSEGQVPAGSLNGGAAIAAPSGSWLLEPTTEEGVHIIELDLDHVHRARANFDPAGHYSRPDVFRVEVNRRRLTATNFTD